jgi:hypothetical protein
MSKALKVGQRVRGITGDLQGKEGKIVGFVGERHEKRWKVDWDDKEVRDPVKAKDIENDGGKPEVIDAKRRSEDRDDLEYDEMEEADQHEQGKSER